MRVPEAVIPRLVKEGLIVARPCQRGCARAARLLAPSAGSAYDFHVVTMANGGFGPVYPFPFARVEVDSYENGARIAAAILTYFDKGAFLGEIVFSPHYVPAYHRTLRNAGVNGGCDD